MIFTFLGIRSRGGGGSPKGLVHNLPDVIMVCKACFRGCSPHLGIGCGGGVSQGIGTQPFMQFFTPDSSKVEVFETGFFDTVTT